MTKSTNIVWHQQAISKKERSIKNGHKSCVLWFTGLSGAGKSTIANSIDIVLFERGIKSYVLDGDNIRHGLNKDLGFSEIDRKENIRRIGEVAKLFVDSGTIVSTAFISPFRGDRLQVRNLFNKDEFIEVYVHCPLSICEDRDPKGLYRKARNGEITDFTGITSPYEAPLHPEIMIDSSEVTIDESVQLIIDYLIDKKILNE
ncbi:adenylyl-sulfate kinase [Bacillus andreraoultii]|uniref:adenylyl-sulfate kinase n=1 Tax=Bacillus andreraoultii TaxID=1499685 RepID=UPI00053ADD86|nr:adenylyl-sulfate kinase [Bacillus andreraoultii]